MDKYFNLKRSKMPLNYNETRTLQLMVKNSSIFDPQIIINLTAEDKKINLQFP